MKEISSKSSVIKAVSIICTLVLIASVLLPGCNFVKSKDKTDGDSDINADNMAQTELVCPVCGSYEVSGPDENGDYICNSCMAQWSYTDNSGSTVDALGNEVDGSADAGIVDIGVSTGGSGSSGSSGSSNTSGGSSSGNKNSGTTTTANTSNPTDITKPSNQMDLITYLKDVGERYKNVIKFKYDPIKNEITVVSPDGSDTGLFGFKYSFTDKVFFTAEDAWQRNFGYSEAYDKASGLGAIAYDTIRVKFSYNNLDWMIQFWKGQYGFVFVGAEIGIYNRKPGVTDTSYYECADDESKLWMSMNVYRRESSEKNVYNLLFSRSKSRTWWLTGFTPGTLQAGSYTPDIEHTGYLKVDAKIHCTDAEMAQAFVEGLKKVTKVEHNAPARTKAFTFTEVSADKYDSSTLNGKYAVESDGCTVRVCWR
ncbi:MAG: DUF4474 domain-containing protein [Clostridia bacterium]|nr:DUF4474 domain-containing protein [Clostridia bacterium]